MQKDCPGKTGQNEDSARDNGEEDLAQSSEAINDDVPQHESRDAEHRALPVPEANHGRDREKAPTIASLLKGGDDEERAEQHTVLTQIDGVVPATKAPQPCPQGRQ